MQANTDDDATLVVVEITSKPELAPIDAHLTVTAGATPVNRGPLHIESGQILSESFSVPRTNDPAIVTLKYTLDGITNMISTAGNPPTKDVSNLLSLLAPVAGVVGVILGALLAHLFTASRERRQADFEWNKMLYERREPAYLEFLASWNLSVSAQQFEQQFRSLKAHAFIPASLVEAGQTLLTRLRDVNLPVEERGRLAKAFHEQVMSAALSPISASRSAGTM
jgi:hypothetical protein